jgi:hypothetical protein
MSGDGKLANRALPRTQGAEHNEVRTPARKRVWRADAQ